MSISSFTGKANTNCPASPTANSTFAVTITWVSSGGTSAKLRDGNSNLTYPVPVSGSKNFSQVCTEGGGVDIYYLTVSTTSTTANPKSVLTNWTMAAHFTN